VLERAGGLSSLAFPSGAVFTRQELQEREQLQIDRLAERLQSDLAASALQASQATQSGSAQALSVGQALLEQLKGTEAVGRLVIDLDRVLATRAGSADDIVLRDGDRLVIPKTKQEVTVIGEVQNTTSHLYRANLTRDDYIGLSGGLTRKADRGRIYIVRADGSVVSSENSGWFRRGAMVAVKPGRHDRGAAGYGEIAAAAAVAGGDVPSDSDSATKYNLFARHSSLWFRRWGG
jgi:polysaccharide biosynthesis/export protein